MLSSYTIGKLRPPESNWFTEAYEAKAFSHKGRNIKIKVRGHHFKWISKIALTHLGPIDLNFVISNDWVT